MESLVHTIPVEVRKILDLFDWAGYSSYIVGGAVRDMMLGRQPEDYDIATAAQPSAILALARQAGWKVINHLGQNFGVIMVVVNGQMVEVAAFRGEKYGTDSHRPEHVWYTDSLAEDMARRDFTINAMAMDKDGQVIDLFGGQKDLADGILRTVGHPNDRFHEDALRMFRACRFRGQLGFRVDDAAIKAIRANLARVNGLSLERVRDELEKTLLGAYCQLGLNTLAETGLLSEKCRIKNNGKYQAVEILPELMHLRGLRQNPQYHRFDAWEHTLAAVSLVPADLLLRWAALLHDLGKGMPGVRTLNADGQPSDRGHDILGSEMAGTILVRLQVKSKLRKRILWLTARHMQFYYLIDAGDNAVRQWLREEARSGYFPRQDDLITACRQLAKLCLADKQAGQGRQDVLEKTMTMGERLVKLARTMPVHTRDLDCQADELSDMLGEGALLAKFLPHILTRVQDGMIPNRREDIFQAAKVWAKKNRASQK